MVKVMIKKTSKSQFAQTSAGKNSLFIRLLTDFVDPRFSLNFSTGVCGSGKTNLYVKQKTSIQALQSVYIKPSNEVYARHLLATRKQQPRESFDEYLHALKILAKECNFKQVSAIEYCDEYIRDAFTTGINSQVVRQRLLENSTKSLDEIFSKARTLESAQKNAENYLQYNTSDTTVAAITKKPKQYNSNFVSNCWNCGNQIHAKAVCPARESICFKCEKVGHFAKLCKSSKLTTAGMNLVDQPLNSYNLSLT
ncbi:uncharacterized protein LOC124808611 [Hydra vulgaris]|uniref:uncharacterized protein LOC124808611 n=1 Tax=Hydra vulgaris TaxID=6087 RepID=UPI0032EA817F